MFLDFYSFVLVFLCLVGETLLLVSPKTGPATNIISSTLN